MFTDFNSLPDDSRIWIYPGNRKFNSDEIVIISEALLAFTQQWMAHGTPLRCSFEIRFNQYIVLCVDEASHGASGCSIDGSVKVLKQLGQQLHLDFFDRTLIGIQKDAGILTLPMGELKKKYQEGVWGRNTLVVNTLISTKGDLINNWLMPAERTWLKRYLPREPVVME